MNLDYIRKMIEKSSGISIILTGQNSIAAVLEKSIQTTKSINGMDWAVNSSHRYNAMLGIGSKSWLANIPAMHSASVDNNVFTINKDWGKVISGISIRDNSQQSIMKALTGGVGSIIKESSFTRLLDTQQSILKQLSSSKPLGLSVNQYRNVFNSLGSLSASIVAQGITLPLRDEQYKPFEETTNEVAKIATSVAKNDYVTSSDLGDLYRLINDLNDKISSKDKSEFNTIGFWICVLSLFLSIYPFVQQKNGDSDPNRTPASKQQIIDSRNDLIRAYKSGVNLYAPQRVTNRKCRLHLNPRLKSHQLMIVAPNEKLSVLNSKGKWVLVTCLDKDSLPVTGWVLKKYLNKSKLK